MRRLSVIFVLCLTPAIAYAEPCPEAQDVLGQLVQDTRDIDDVIPELARLIEGLRSGALSFADIQTKFERGEITRGDYLAIRHMFKPLEEELEPPPEIPFDITKPDVRIDEGFPTVLDIEATPDGLRVLKQSAQGNLRVGDVDVPLDNVDAAELMELEGGGLRELVVSAGGKVHVFVHPNYGSPKHSADIGEDTEWYDAAFDIYLDEDVHEASAPAEFTDEEQAWEDATYAFQKQLERDYKEMAIEEVHFVDYGNDLSPDAFVLTDTGEVRFHPSGRKLPVQWSPDAKTNLIAAGDVTGDGVPDLVMRVRNEGEADRLMIFKGKTPTSGS